MTDKIIFATLPKRMKTNKSYTKRITVTKNGKLKTRAPGINHFNAKKSRSSQLNAKVKNDFPISNKSKARFLPGLVK